mgnify:CR=1 FL=1
MQLDEYTIKYLKGVERDANPLPSNRDARGAYLAQNCSVGRTPGTVEKFGGRGAIYNSGISTPAHVVGLMEARLGAGDNLVACLTGTSLTSQTIGKLTYSGTSWTFTDIRRIGASTYTPTCPVARRFSASVLKDILVLSDYGQSGLEKWDGLTTYTEALTLGGTPGFTTLKARYLHTVADYLFAAHVTEDGTVYPDRIRWSYAGNPELWAPNDYYTLSTKDGDICMGLANIQNIVVGFKRKSIWMGLFMDAASGWNFEQQVAGRGTLSPFGIVTVGNYVVFPSNDGIYIFEGSPEPRKISGTKISKLFLSGFTEEDFYQIIAAVHPTNPEIWFCAQRGAYPTWIYNYETDDWANASLNYEALAVGRPTMRLTWANLATAPNRPTWGSMASQEERTWALAFNQSSAPRFMGGGTSSASSKATIFEADTASYYDEVSTTPLTATYRTLPTDCALPSRRKRFSKIILRLKPTAATLTVRVYVDGVKVGIDITTAITSSSSDFIEKAVYCGNVVGTSISIEIESAVVTEFFQLMGYTVVYVPRERLK